MDALLGIVVLIISAVIIVVDFADHRKQWRQEDAEYDAFEQHRAERQAVFDWHAQEVAHHVLIETCETIYIGNWKGGQ